MYLQVMFHGSELEEVSRLHDSVIYDYRRYTYWADGRQRWRLGDRVRVPTHDGTDEAEATVVALERGDWDGPYDSVIERVARAPDYAAVISDDLLEALSEQDSRRIATMIPVSDEFLADYNAMDAHISRQMVARWSLEERVRMQVTEPNMRVLDPGNYVGRITDVQEDEDGLRVTAEVDDPETLRVLQYGEPGRGASRFVAPPRPTCTSTDAHHVCEDHPCTFETSASGQWCGRIVPHVHPGVEPSHSHEAPPRVTSFVALEPADGQEAFIELEFSDGSRRTIRRGETIEQRSAPTQDLYSWQSPFPMGRVATGYPEVRIIDVHGVASPWYEIVPS